MLSVPDISNVSKYYHEDRVTRYFIDYFNITRLAACSNLDLTIDYESLSLLVFRGIRVIYNVLNHLIRLTITNNIISILDDTFDRDTSCVVYGDFAETVYRMKLCSDSMINLPTRIHVHCHDRDDATRFINNMSMCRTGNRSIELYSFRDNSLIMFDAYRYYIEFTDNINKTNNTSYAYEVLGNNIYQKTSPYETRSLYLTGDTSRFRITCDYNEYGVSFYHICDMFLTIGSTFDKIGEMTNICYDMNYNFNLFTSSNETNSNDAPDETLEYVLKSITNANYEYDDQTLAIYCNHK